MIFPMFADFALSSVMPLLRIHALANSNGEYQIPPRIMLATAAASTAQTFIISCIALPCRLAMRRMLVSAGPAFL
jgi:hypothetical protein